APHDPLEIGADFPLAPPAPEHPFGTDDLGRDVLSRILFGAQISLTVAFLSGLAALCLGGPLGLAAGYRGCKADGVISGLLDTICACPSILLGIALVAVLGSGILSVVLAVAVINVPIIGRLVRDGVLAQRNQEYVEAARVLGASGVRVVGRHILPNVVPP